MTKGYNIFVPLLKMASVIVRVRQGDICGKLTKNYKNGTFYSFHGIPYAKPPVGDLRFKAPQKPDEWSGVLDATTEKDGCISANIYTGEVQGSDDCLHLNIYTPELNSKNQSSTLKPIMVFIHGGSFILGNAKTEIFGPEFLLTEDVVLVTLTYRLGALGFTSLADGSLGVPGNHGIRDVLMALNWIQENIIPFNGDPENVTLFGQSGGATMIHYMMLSPQGKGLFHKAILQSGSALTPWAVGRKDSLREVAKILKCPHDTDKDILGFLIKQSVEDIYQAQLQVKTPPSSPIPRHCYPVIEDNNNIEEPIISEKPGTILSKGNYNKMPMMIGYNSNEGIIFDYLIGNKMKNENSKLVSNFEIFVPYTLGYKKGSPESKRVAEKIKNFYFGGRNPNTDDRQKLRELYADINLTYFLHDTAYVHLKTSDSPIFFYKFDLDTKLNLYKRMHRVDFQGASHCDELCYLFKMSKNSNVDENSIEDISIQRMVKLWVNFAKTNNPTAHSENTDRLINVKWKPIEEHKLHYLHIGKELSMAANPDEAVVEFWREVYKMSPIPKI